MPSALGEMEQHRWGLWAACEATITCSHYADLDLLQLIARLGPGFDIVEHGRVGAPSAMHAVRGKEGHHQGQGSEPDAPALASCLADPEAGSLAHGGASRTS